MATTKQRAGSEAAEMDAQSSAEIVKTLESFEPPAPLQFSRDEEMRAYRDMLLIRRFEE